MVLEFIFSFFCIPNPINMVHSLENYRPYWHANYIIPIMHHMNHFTMIESRNMAATLHK